MRRLETWRRWWAGVAFAFCAGTAGWSATAELVASAEKGWPQFRGVRRDGVSLERGLRGEWPEGGPPLVWTAKGAGKGFSSTIIADGRLFVTGDFGEDLFIVAYDLAGKELWRTRNGAAWLNQYQGARASVTYRDGKVYQQNAHGRVACLEAATGREIWAVNVLERWRGENITWGISECLLVDDGHVYVTPGGRDALVVALDRATGEPRWKIDAAPGAGNANEGGAGYAAPILVRFADRRLMIGASARELFCVDLDARELQWTRARPTSYSVLAASPALVGDGVFMTAPFGPPGTLHRLVAPQERGGRVGVEDAWTTKLDTAQGGVVHASGRVFGSYYPRRGGWAALDAASGRVLYEAPELTKGAAVWANGRLYALSEDGGMSLLEPTESEFAVRGKFRLTNARDRDAWAHPVICDGRLYLRYHDTMWCYDVRTETKPAD